MNDYDMFLDAGNIKFRTAHRDTMYNQIKTNDTTNLLNSLSNLFYVAFAIGYHFDKPADIEKKSINHVNLVSFDIEIKELMVHLILKRKKDIVDPKELWKLVERYAEYGIQVLHNSWKKNKYIDIDEILEVSD